MCAHLFRLILQIILIEQINQAKSLNGQAQGEVSFSFGARNLRRTADLADKADTDVNLFQ